MLLLVGGSILFGIYTVASERTAGATLGKRLAGLRVVQESGARITPGRAVVRHLPMFLQFYWRTCCLRCSRIGASAPSSGSKTRVVVSRSAEAESSDGHRLR